MRASFAKGVRGIFNNNEWPVTERIFMEVIAGTKSTP
jgi:hypothetical protein